MDFTEYRQRGKEMVDYIADYLENIRDRRVYPDVKPGYMSNLLPSSAPVEGEAWDCIFADVEKVIMPGVTHWQSPHMHAYFPALNSFPSLLGDMLADAINCLGFTWASSPACTELELIVMNWLGKMIGLPDEFLHAGNDSKGGGVIQTTASEATLVCLLAGRTKAIQKFHEQLPGYKDAEINAKFVAYCSDQAHSSVEKAALIGLVRMRFIETDDNLSMRGQPLREAIEDDIKQGLVPFWVCATLGTTGSCAFDNLEEVGIVCREFKLWLHVDAAYAGSAFICPEYRTWLKGIEHADSIAFNPSKWLMVHFDATALWVKDSTAVHRTFNVEPLYLIHENSGVAVDYMHWQIPLSRRFRALKIWFVLRTYGIKGLQKHIREGVRLAQKFEALVLADNRFEIPANRYLGLVVFRLKGADELTERLLKRLNQRGNIHCIPSKVKGKYVIRFTVTSTVTTADDIIKDWSEIRLVATMILEEVNCKISEHKLTLKVAPEKREFGSSLLLWNSPLSPKIINGSFAAICDADEFLAKSYAGVRISHQESPSMRRRVRGILMSGKQFSLDSHMDVVVQTCLDSSTTTTQTDSYGKTATDTNKQPNPIREDNEESWEVYESLIKTPITPPAFVSPLLLTPIHQFEFAKVNNQMCTRHFGSSASATNDTMRANNRCQPPQTLTIPPPSPHAKIACNAISPLIDDPQRVGLFRPSITLTTQMHSASRAATHSKHYHQSSSDNSMSPLREQQQQQQHNDSVIPVINNNISARRRNEHHPAAVSRTAYRRGSTLSSSEDDSTTLYRKIHSGNSVYPGKRYLDPVAHLFEECAYTNSVFNSTNPLELTTKTNAITNTSVDWMAVLQNFNSAPPRRRPNKIRLRINDEHGRRIPSSFDSTGTDESCSPRDTPFISPQTPLLPGDDGENVDVENTNPVQLIANNTVATNSISSSNATSNLLLRNEEPTTNCIRNEVSTFFDLTQPHIVLSDAECSTLSSHSSSLDSF